MNTTDPLAIVSDIDIAQFAKQGLKILISELMLQKRHLQMVRNQNAALLAADRVRFVEMHEKHVELVSELAMQSKLRISVLGTGNVENVIKDWPDTDKRNALKVIAELKAVVQDVKRINEQNSKLLVTQVKYIDFMLNLLVRTYRKGSTYGPQGAQSLDRGNLFFNSAV